MLVSPQGREFSPSNLESKKPLTPNLTRLLNQATSSSPQQKSSEETLFQLSYEYKPFNCNVDYR